MEHFGHLGMVGAWNAGIVPRGTLFSGNFRSRMHLKAGNSLDFGSEEAIKAKNGVSWHSVLSFSPESESPDGHAHSSFAKPSDLAAVACQQGAVPAAEGSAGSRLNSPAAMLPAT